VYDKLNINTAQQYQSTDTLYKVTVVILPSRLKKSYDKNTQTKCDRARTCQLNISKTHTHSQTFTQTNIIQHHLSDVLFSQVID